MNSIALILIGIGLYLTVSALTYVGIVLWDRIEENSTRYSDARK